MHAKISINSYATIPIIVWPHLVGFPRGIELWDWFSVFKNLKKYWIWPKCTLLSSAQILFFTADNSTADVFCIVFDEQNFWKNGANITVLKSLMWYWKNRECGFWKCGNLVCNLYSPSDFSATGGLRRGGGQSFLSDGHILLSVPSERPVSTNYTFLKI